MHGESTIALVSRHLVNTLQRVRVRMRVWFAVAFVWSQIEDEISTRATRTDTHTDAPFGVLLHKVLAQGNSWRRRRLRQALHRL